MLKLNIYERGEVLKTYESDTADILYGTLEDLLELVDLDKLGDFESQASKVEIGKVLFKAVPLLMPFLKEIFIGLTDEEIRKTKVKELVPLFMEIFKYAFSEITNLGGNNSGN